MIDESLPHFELVKVAALAGADRSLRKRYERGELVRVRSGVYLTRDAWSSLDADGRYRARVAAAATAAAESTQFSHDSAAALWRLPTLGPWSRDLHVLGPRYSGGRSNAGLRYHGLGRDAAPEAFNGIQVTSLARTVIDISCTTPFARAVGMADNALRPPGKEDFRHIMGVPPVTPLELTQLVADLEPYYASARASRVLEFADGRSASLGESLSRVNIHFLGFPPPQLQVPFSDGDGFIGYVDFYWPELDLIGEFDGYVKYREARYLNGRSAADAVIDEKVREDRLRRVCRAFARWDWAVARDRLRLAERLGAHGLIRTR